MFNNHNFAVGAYANRQQQPLTIDQIAQYAPSAVATQEHSSRSDRYTFVPTTRIIEGMAKNGFQPFKATQSRSRIEGKSEFTKHMITFRYVGDVSSETQELMKVGDVRPQINLVNSHDGTSSYQLLAGMFRLACSNGLMVCEGEFDSIRIQHTGDILQNVIEGSYRIVKDSQKVLTSVAEWNQLQLTNGEQNALAEAAHFLRFADTEGKITTPITAAQLLQTRRTVDGGSDLWHTFNRVQENVIKGGLHGVDRSNGRRRNVTTREVKGIDQDVKLNRAMWQLAARMANLKTGRETTEQILAA
jgi:hypothetical protein